MATPAPSLLTVVLFLRTPKTHTTNVRKLKNQEFERLRGATATGESEKRALQEQLKALAEKNRSEKHRMDELLEGVIHSQKGELEKRKAEFVDLQVPGGEERGGKGGGDGNRVS